VPRTRSGKVALGSIGLVQAGELSYEPAQALFESIVPGTRNVRYDRDWRMGQFERSGRNGRWLTGRIGFQLSGTQTEVWDDNAKDFRRAALREGFTSPYAIDLQTLRLAFQLRPGFIKPTTFTSNFKALLEKASGAYRWRVEHEVDSIPWEEWQKEVDRITEIRVRVERPNPGYHGRRQIKSLIEGSKAKIVTLVYKADPDGVESINVNAVLLAQALDHAEEYGSFEAKGEISEEGFVQKTQWREDVEGSPKQKEMAIDPETGEVRPDDLRDALTEEHPE